MRTLAQLAQEACNMQGLVHGFSRAITDLRANLGSVDTDTINNHFISRLRGRQLRTIRCGD